MQSTANDLRLIPIPKAGFGVLVRNIRTKEPELSDARTILKKMINCDKNRKFRKNQLERLKQPVNFRPTTLVKIYWEFLLFPRFSKFEVLTRKSILGYLLNVIGYFNLVGVYRLQGYIPSLVGTFLTFCFLKS